MFKSWKWPEFCEHFVAKFGVWEQDLIYDNFKQLQQTTTVELFYGQFEKYGAHLMEKMPTPTEERVFRGKLYKWIEKKNLEVTQSSHCGKGVKSQ